jgi:D-sedoheptulose 7-phosphate isomerase
MHVDVKATDPDRYRGFIRETKFGDVVMTDILLSEQRIRRGRQHISQLDKDCYYVHLVHKGSVTVSQRGESIRSNAARGAILSAIEQYERCGQCEVRSFYLELPREALSLCYLHMLFAAGDLSASEWSWDRRLQLAYHDIARGEGRTITSIAMDTASTVRRTSRRDSDASMGFRPAMCRVPPSSFPRCGRSTASMLIGPGGSKADLDVTHTAADLFASEIEDHRASVALLVGLRDNFLSLCTLGQQCLGSGGKILFFGNGGSAADSQHLASELTVRYRRHRKALAGLALTTDTSVLTAVGNDLGFEHVFSRQLEALAQPNDLVIALTTSGRSPNILQAIETAKAMEVRTVVLSGQMGLPDTHSCDLLIKFPSERTARIQEMHILFGHMFCDVMESVSAA